MLTQTDINLLQRVIKILREDARTLYDASTPWTDTEVSKRDKATYDRLCREERDLVALRARLARMLALQGAQGTQGTQAPERVPERAPTDAGGSHG